MNDQPVAPLFLLVWILHCCHSYCEFGLVVEYQHFADAVLVDVVRVPVAEDKKLR